MSKREREAEPLQLDLDTSESVITDYINPHLEQLVELTNIALSRSSDENKQTAGAKHAKALARRVGFCVRMSFDYQMFAQKGTFSYQPVQTTTIVPSAASPHSVLVMACNESVVSWDKCRATFLNPVLGQPNVEAHPQHLMGNLFCIPVPGLYFLTEKKTAVEVQLKCDGKYFTASVELSNNVPARAVPHKPYTPSHLPLHYAALGGNVTSVIMHLDQLSSDQIKVFDECGTEPAALALFGGNRVIYSLFCWKSFNWPVYAVCQMLRCRLELDSSLIEVEQFSSVRDGIHEFVFHSGPNMVYRPVKYKTFSSVENQGSLAVMLLPEIPYTEHEATEPPMYPNNSHRRGSLDLLLKAIDTVDSK